MSQKSVKEFDVRDLTDAEQDQFIREVAESMAREFRERTKDTPPLGDAAFWVTGPHHDPIQGIIHVHHLAVWVDLDRVPNDAPFRLDADFSQVVTEGGAAPLTGGEAAQ